MDYLYVSGYGPAITRFIFDAGSGELSEPLQFEAGTSPSYLAFAPDLRRLYAVNEAAGADSRVIAFAIDPDTGELREINRAPSGGEGAPHLAVHPSGRWIAVAHYTSGHTTVLPVRDDGGVEAPVRSARGPDGAAEKAHQALFDRSGDHLFVPCLGSDYVLQFEFDEDRGTLAYDESPAVAVAGGPRHMAFDPGAQHAYVLSELDSRITRFDYDVETGHLTVPRSIDSYQRQAGASAHIMVDPTGRFLYASNRAENSIGLFPIDAAGRPHAAAFVHERIATPRDFTIDPTGSFLLAANQSGAQDVLVFRIHPHDGTLDLVHEVPVGGHPTFVGIVSLP
jgi:6-phosphogluconolactonase